MKYLILLVVVLVVLWLLRSGRRDETPPARKRKDAPNASPQDMVQCPVCLVHLPRSDALPGPDGQLYCCAAHRLRAQEK
ncbi:MAG: hypothetical protein K0R89_2288 [Ramlibacter sp.]|jgi:uncharacterized protein|nr:hypothetical protein [Ramlibacter sp.]